MDMREWSTDRIERLAIDAETEIARHRAVQAAALAELDRRQTPTADGCRTLAEWTASRLDVSPETARDLVRAARGVPDRPDLAAALVSGDAGFDRAVALVGSTVGVDESFGWDVAGLRRVIARWSRAICEPMPYTDRYLAIQPSLDQSRWKLWGQLTGDAGAIVEQALTERADTFPPLPDGARESMAARRADALLTLCADSVSSPRAAGPLGEVPPQAAEGAAHHPCSREPLVTVFVDATTSYPRPAAPDSSPGERSEHWGRWRRQAPDGALGEVARRAGGGPGEDPTEPAPPLATIPAGPVLDPGALSALACEGSIEVTGITGDGTPLRYGRKQRAIPPQLRRYVLHRDGGCVADGCTSRYRLQPHHVIPWSDGGTTDHDNLATLCWFHHHVVVHRHGYRINPASPAHRRRFLPPGHDPP